MCSSQKKRVKKIINNAIVFLYSKIKSFDKYEVTLDDLKGLFENNSFGKLKVDNVELTFIDMIKGILPLKIVEYLTKEVKMNIKDVNQSCVIFLDYVYDETALIWKERCETQIQKEKKFKISKKKKRLIRSYDVDRKNVTSRNPIASKSFTKVEGL
ncbi:hypothetical protein C1646_668507 [Rhizophagus diaphanus]|nr:hypothetical protein C1646_668507 [Rhizophagus diaphanus] [Rhizophagus sp. MUCL 43196]